MIQPWPQMQVKKRQGIYGGGYSGEPRAARTHDPRLKRAMLYQLS